jgi:hypothetical protein
MSAVDPYLDLVIPIDDDEPDDEGVGLTGPVGSVGLFRGVPAVGSAASVGSVGYSGEVLDRVRAWLGRFILTY